MIYDARSRANIAKLADNTRAAALKWYEYCVKNNIEILVYETIRTVEQQKKNVASGASQTMKSYHIVGQALDFVPVNSKGAAQWSIAAYTTPKVLAAINYAKTLGFTWGGDWDNDGDWRDEKFLDSPHLQFNYKGYGTDTFGKAPTTSIPTTSKPSTSTGTNTAISLVDWMKAKGMDSSYANRAKLAKANGIANYSGSAKQNLQLLEKLQAKSSATTTKPTATKKFTSLVDYLKSQGIDSSFANRAKLAKANGITNYSGTAAQNTQLLNKLQK